MKKTIKIIITISIILFIFSLFLPSYTADPHDKFFKNEQLSGIEAYIYLTLVGLFIPFLIVHIDNASQVPLCLSAFFIALSNILIPLSPLCQKFRYLCKLYFILVPIFLISVIVASRDDFYVSFHFGIYIWLISMLLFSSIPFLLYFKKEKINI
jgi:hypothetical protein